MGLGTLELAVVRMQTSGLWLGAPSRKTDNGLWDDEKREVAE